METGEISSFDVGASITRGSLAGLVIKLLLKEGTNKVFLIPEPQAKKLIDLLQEQQKDRDPGNRNPDSLEHCMNAAAGCLNLQEIEGVPACSVIHRVSLVPLDHGKFEIEFANRENAVFKLSADFEWAEWLEGYLTNVLQSTSSTSSTGESLH